MNGRRDNERKRRLAADFGESGIACVTCGEIEKGGIENGMHGPKSSDPLHGVTLERLLTELVAHFGWDEMGSRVAIRCFLFDPSIKSSLTFLRRNPWARTKVEALYADWKSRG
jgi:DNA-binding protein VF530